MRISSLYKGEGRGPYPRRCAIYDLNESNVPNAMQQNKKGRSIEQYPNAESF